MAKDSVRIGCMRRHFAGEAMADFSVVNILSDNIKEEQNVEKYLEN